MWIIFLKYWQAAYYVRYENFFILWMQCFCLNKASKWYPCLCARKWTCACVCISMCTCVYHPCLSIWGCRWAQATWTYYRCDGFSFVHHPISNHFCLSPAQPSHVSHTQHKIPGHFLPQRGMIHISYIACKSLGQNCFDEALEVAGGRLAPCLTFTVSRIQTSFPQKL